MIIPNYSRMTTEELLRRFIEGAIRHAKYPPIPLAPEAERIETEIVDVAEELRARKPLAALRQLFTHESRAVRGRAAGLFLGTDPDWAEATFDGLMQDMTTEEAMALRKRAERLPPEFPTAQQMSIAELVARFEDVGIRLIGAKFIGDDDGQPDTNVRNRLVRETTSVANELEARNALSALLPLLDHEKLMVRYVAAIFCLPIASAKAVPILEAMAASNDTLEASQAKHVLERWRGELEKR